ncbi:hypothetical protein KY362_02195 [Candidatus Woesearchaeota archaeon]|nr:hypothetical protein [Candidatus Woesearchaeota archaeon]
MKKRQLFVANNKAGVRVNIDSIDRAAKEDYFCPYCNKEVVARLGSQKVWHFAHKGEVCEYLNIKSSDGLSDSKLDFSGVATVDLDAVDIGMESKDFLCVQCKKRFNKHSGLKWKGNEYICRECFENM